MAATNIKVTLQPLQGWSPLENPKSLNFLVGEVDKDNLPRIFDEQIGFFKDLNRVAADSRLMYAFKDENDEVVSLTLDNIIATLQETSDSTCEIFIRAFEKKDNHRCTRMEPEGGSSSVQDGSSRVWDKHLADKMREAAANYCHQCCDGRFKLPSEGGYWAPGLLYTVYQVFRDGVRLRVPVTRKSIKSRLQHYMSNVNARIRRAERSRRGEVADDKDVVSEDWLRARRSSCKAWEEAYGHHVIRRSYPTAWGKVINLSDHQVRIS